MNSVSETYSYCVNDDYLKNGNAHLRLLSVVQKAAKRNRVFVEEDRWQV